MCSCCAAVVKTQQSNSTRNRNINTRFLAKISTSASQPGDKWMWNCCLAGSLNAIRSCQNQQQQIIMSSSDVWTDTEVCELSSVHWPKTMHFLMEVLCPYPGPTCSPDEGQVWQRARPTSSVTCGLLSRSLQHSAPTLLHFCLADVLSTLSLLSPTGLLLSFFGKRHKESETWSSRRKCIPSFFNLFFKKRRKPGCNVNLKTHLAKQKKAKSKNPHTLCNW